MQEQQQIVALTAHIQKVKKENKALEKKVKKSKTKKSMDNPLKSGNGNGPDDNGSRRIGHRDGYGKHADESDCDRHGNETLTHGLTHWCGPPRQDDAPRAHSRRRESRIARLGAQEPA